jgi:hypothetical protein
MAPTLRWIGGAGLILLLAILFALPTVSTGSGGFVSTESAVHAPLNRPPYREAQPWYNLTNLSVNAPSSRNGSSMAYDANDGYVVDFGGLRSNGSLLGDTWTYRAGHWTQLVVSPGAGPSPRAFASMTYDTADRAVLLFGGTDNATISNATKLNDTWEFSNGTWSQLHPATSPPARCSASLAYDAKDGDALLFGGYTTHGPAADSWTYVGGTWTRLTTSGGTPVPRYGGAMGYDVALQEIVLTGGRGLAGQNDHQMNLTWTFQGGNWAYVHHEPSFASKPFDRFGASIASSANVTLLAGGTEAYQQRLRHHGGAPSNWVLDPYYFGGHWKGQMDGGGTHAHAPPVTMPDQFAGLVWDAADGYFVFVVDGTTWVTA